MYGVWRTASTAGAAEASAPHGIEREVQMVIEGEMAERMLAAATAAREHAYCPYSRYPVGAAVLDTEGRVHVGCNVENASSGLTVCAERNAVAAMVAAGGRKVAELAVVTSNGALPCGACLQVISEHAAAPDIPLRVYSDGPNPTARVFALNSLLPEPFRKQR